MVHLGTLRVQTIHLLSILMLEVYLLIKKENTRIQITIPKKIQEKLKDLAEYEGRTVSNMAAKIILDYFKENNNTLD